MAACWGAVGIAAIVLVQPGLPYDEPAHWANTLYFVDHRSIPVIGHPGVHYEAQQGPVAYVLAAVVEAVAHEFTGSRAAGFNAVRALGGVELGATVLVAWRLLRRLVPSQPARSAALVYLAFCPMFVAMSWSVQNDALSLLLIFSALELALARMDDGLRTVDAALVGVLVGLGLLTKLTALPLVVAIPVWLAMRHRRGCITAAASFAASVGVVSGWWFIRNEILYDRLLPTASLPRGPHFSGVGVHGFETIGHMVQNVVTYLWVPTEYYRNLVSAPIALKGGLALLAAACLVLAVTTHWQRKGVTDPPSETGAVDRASPWFLVTATAVVAMAMWIIIYVSVSGTSSRLAYAALPWWLGVVGLGTSRVVAWLPVRVRPFVPAIVLVALLYLNFWVLAAAHRLPLQPFHITLN